MTCFRSILFDESGIGAGFDGREAPEFFTDLNLDQIVASITAGREEYNLKPFFMSAELDDGNKGTRYVLRKPWDTKPGWMERLQAWGEQLLLSDRSDFVYQIADRDESGFRALTELRGRGIGIRS